ncbi:hypothetical protein ABW636_01965 [Aquimarina sp. 2201CG1-2-11]|uniref:hypothetical protein n=1 Tax=Aquimarina discodermiae TaxID=3231043 RepID=UPI0034631A58
MKNILNLDGVKKIGKQAQKQIQGGWRRFNYCKPSNPRQCCFRLPNGQEICDAGRCSGTRCLYWE